MTEKAIAESARAANRSDFMRRIFSVAVSVGFASTLTRMDWIVAVKAPDGEQWHQIAILLTALLATIGSWEGYFSAVDKRPLKKAGRFIIDIVLVFVYMVLLLTSGHSYLFPLILAFVFMLYVIWDALTINEYPEYYFYGVKEKIPYNLLVVRTYTRGTFDTKNEVRRGHVSTGLWTIYFITLAGLSLIYPNFNVYTLCIMSSIGLIGYRLHKAPRYDAEGAEKRKEHKIVYCQLGSIVFLLLITFAIL